MSQASPAEVEAARQRTARIREGFAEIARLKALMPRNQEPKPADTRAVYFLQAQNGLIKIGVASDPNERLKTIRTMSPIPIRIVGLLPGAGAAGEASLHARFADHRSHGEWFHPSAELFDYIRENACQPS